MTIAELAVNLGVKGTEKVGSALTGVRKQMSGITSTSLEAKAAIIGVMYGLERLTAQSGQMGTSLAQFNSLTGLSADQLQRWQYLALKSGESAQEMAGSIQAVQNAMSKMILGQGAPQGITALKNVVGFDINKARDTFYVMDKLREYAQKTKDLPDIRNQVMRTFGLSDNTIQAMATSKVNLANVPLDHMYTEGQTKRLNEVNIAWASLGDKIEHSFGKLNSKFGPKMISDISSLADQVLRLVDAFASLAQQLQLVAVFGDIFKGWTEIFKTAGDATKAISSAKKTGNWQGLLPDSDTMKVFLHSLFGDPIAVPKGGANHTTHVQTNVTVHGMTDGDELAAKISGHVKTHLDKQNNRTARQLPAGGGY
jgi:hypothetical protein